MIKKLKRIEVEEKLKSMGLTVFTPQEFKDIFEVSQNTASVFITSNIKSGLFVKLRNGIYLIKDTIPPHYFISNKLYQPSYISLETALSYYGVIPEMVYSFTSVTSKASREYETPVGNFTYQTIKKEAFTGYQLKEVNREKVLIADIEKALADYLYFVELKKISLNDRLELRNVNKDKLIKYAKLFNRQGMLKLIEQIYVEYRKPRKIY
ncbi:MAG: hypothetical protein XD75_0333 [Parcubacteria bacterium 33_209]|nr:MAG: hypothetical protein XD75_0333 [Parcubacteria bacterium 33_209]